ncbi:MAG: hypothetical protein C5S47_07800 [Candidatus Methanogasteraceae archaeon]|nr:MAG: hypothetical protein C5S47_07800 [ANME-2 cluster archaeon]
MFDFSALMSCLTICLDATTLARLRVIVSAMLAMTGRVTMLGISLVLTDSVVFNRYRKKAASYPVLKRCSS